MGKEIDPEIEQYVQQAYTELNPLTGLYFNRTFMKKAKEFLTEIQSGAYCMVAVDMAHFRLFNKFYGRDAWFQSGRLENHVDHVLRTRYL